MGTRGMAGIGYLLMSLEKPADSSRKARLDDLFGLSPEALKDCDEEIVKKRREKKDEVISQCDTFLFSITDDSEQYDIIMEEIDMIVAEENCAEIESLWILVKFVIDDADYSGNKKRLLRHLARKWGIEAETLKTLEDSAKTMSAIEQERETLTASDKPYREVCTELAALDARKAETLAAVYVLWGEATITADKSDNGDYEAESVLDKVGDGVVDVIQGVADGVCNVIDGFTSAVTRLW